MPDAVGIARVINTCPERQSHIDMDKVTEIRRTINYVSDLVNKSDRLITSSAGMDYYEYHRNYREVIAYLNSSNERIKDKIPELVKPNIFNRRVGGLWTIAVFGIFNPFFIVFILTITFPASVPYLIIRALTLRRTKNRIQEGKIFLTRMLNRLNEQQVDMTGR